MAAKEVELTQAILDYDNDKVKSFLQDESIKSWINNHVPVKVLRNHKFTAEIEWTTALCRASSRAEPEIVRALIQAGARVNDVNSAGDSAMHVACSGQIDTDLTLDKVKILLHHDDFLKHIRDPERCSALHCAAQTGKKDVCEYLITQGADVHMRNEDRSTALHLAAGENHVGVIQCLIKHGANLDARTYDEATPLHEATFHGAYEVMCFLLDRGLDVDLPGQNNGSLLNYACQGGHIECMKELLKRGAKVDQIDDSGKTPLYMGALFGKTESIKLLIENHGADVNAQTTHGSTPLHAASYAGHLDVVKALTSSKTQKCDIDIPNDSGETACDVAKEEGHTEVETYLTDLHLSRHLMEGIPELGTKKTEPEQGGAPKGMVASYLVQQREQRQQTELLRAVRRSREWLIQTLNASDHLDFLYFGQVLTREQYHAIKEDTSNAGQVTKLMDVMDKKPDLSWISVFMQSLKNKSPDVAQKLTQN